jgi:outer membrane protein, heavy metal efflux system
MSIRASRLSAFIVSVWYAGAAAAPPASEPRPPSQTAVAPLTLSAAVAQARTASPRQRGAALVADGARDAVRLAGRLPNPLFELRTENWGPSRDPASPPLDVFAVVTQPFELGRKRAVREQLAAADADIAGSALRSLERELALDTVRAYVRALKARALLRALSRNRDGLKMLVASLDLRVEEGYSAEADLLKFKTEAARVEGEIVRARLELERSLTALGILIGASAPIESDQLIEPAPLEVPSADAGIVAASVLRHPEVIAASALVDRARHLTAFERARRVPDPLVTGGYKRTAGFDTMVLGVSIAIPVFDRNGASLSRSIGLERGAIADRDAIVFRLTRDTESVILAARTIAEQVKNAPQELLEPAEGVRRAALAAFREGTADVLQLIDAERVYADVHRAAIDLRLDALLIAIEARFALGEETVP